MVQITDNDGKGIVLSPTSITVTEGGGATTYTVALGSQPDRRRYSGDNRALGDRCWPESHVAVLHHVHLEHRAECDGERGPGTETQTTTSEALTHAASEGGYAGVTAVLAVTVTDDDAKATGALIIDGLPEVGETLTVDTSQIMDADGLSRPG